MEYALAHITAHLLGQENADHPRQRAIHWLLEYGWGSYLRDFNYHYGLIEPAIRECFPHVAVRRVAKALIHDAAAADALCHNRPCPGRTPGAGAPGAGTPPPAGVH